MPSKYWENFADLSCDSSAESSHDPQELSADVEEVRTPKEEAAESIEDGDSKWVLDSKEDAGEQNSNTGTISRVMAANFQLPNLQPHQHASLFYLSLIEGRCRTQAAASINAGRSLEDCVAEDHPDVSDLAKHLFAEMSKELIKAGMIPEEFVGRPLPELRLYLSSFDSILSGISSTRPHDLSDPESYRAIDLNYNLPRGSVATLLSSDTSVEASVPITRPSRQSEFRPTFRTAGPRSSSPFDKPSQHAITTTRYNPSHRPFFTTPFKTSQAPVHGSAPTSPFEQPSYESAAPGNYISFQNSISSLSEQEQSRALVLRDRAFAMSQKRSPGPAARFVSLMCPELTQLSDSSIPESIFETQYTDKAVIGKGGFGRVYKARYYLDKAEYAIKKIAIPAVKVAHLLQSGKLTDLPREAQALAKLNHPHVVRYHHSWVETRLAMAKSDRNGSGSSSGSDSDESGQTLSLPIIKSGINALTSQIESVSLDNYAELEREFRRRRRNSTTHELSEEEIVFGEDSIPPSPSLTTEKAPISSKKERVSFFRSPSEPDSDDEEDRGNTSPSSPSKRAIVPLTSAIDYDVIIYIKMTSYPLSLQDYIEKEQHCFHPLPTIRILRKLLAGVAYLHRKNIIHRDLKPGNVFLAFPDEEELPVPGEAFVDLGECRECGGKDKGKGKATTKWITPCIGDFGLVADLKNTISTTSPSSSTYSAAAAGTRFYTPLIPHGTKPVICPKLDVYALGVIAFELCNKFGTKSERVRTMEDLRVGKFPPGWGEEEEEEGGCVLREGVRGMLKREREERWSCEKVGGWLAEMEKVLVGE